MDLKIFKAGFDEKEFNEFCQSNIVYKMHFMTDGAVYVFWKSPNRLGRTAIEQIESLDRIIKQAQDEISGHTLDKQNNQTDIADYKSEINKFHENQGEYKQIQARITDKERQIKMADETIALREQQILSATERAQDLLNSI